MKKFCKVIFSFEPDIEDDSLKDELIKEFVDVRNGVCEILNQNYEEWNSEFDLLFPDDDNYEKDINGLTTNYRMFISEKQNSILKVYLTNHYPNTKMKYYFSLDCLDLTGRFNETKVEAFLKQV